MKLGIAVLKFDDSSDSLDSNISDYLYFLYLKYVYNSFEALHTNHVTHPWPPLLRLHPTCAYPNPLILQHFYSSRFHRNRRMGILAILP